MAQQSTRILHITDPHVFAAAHRRMHGLDTLATLQAVLQRAMSDPSPPVAILATGDLVHDESQAGYERLADALSVYELPVYCLPGNHDEPAAMHATLKPPTFQVGGVVSLTNWTLLLLHTHQMDDDGGRVTPDELAMVEDTLASAEVEHALICLHHQPVPMGSHWLDNVGLRNSEDLLAILDRFSNVRGIVWGHVHQASEHFRKGVRLFSTPSTCFQFLPRSEYFVMDTRPPGFRWLDLQADGRIDSEVVWLT